MKTSKRTVQYLEGSDHEPYLVDMDEEQDALASLDASSAHRKGANLGAMLGDLDNKYWSWTSKQHRTMARVHRRVAERIKVSPDLTRRPLVQTHQDLAAAHENIAQHKLG